MLGRGITRSGRRCTPISKIEVRDTKENLLGQVQRDDPMPREGELFFDETEMYRVINVHHEYKGWRRKQTIVLVEYVANVGM